NNAVKTQTSIITITIAGVDVLTTHGFSSVVPGSSFITPVAFAIASTPDNASTIPTKANQFFPNVPCNGWRRTNASLMCGRQKSPSVITTMTAGMETR